jgi:hypothetical protein
MTTEDRAVLLRLVADAIYRHAKGIPIRWHAASLRKSRRVNTRSPSDHRPSAIDVHKAWVVGRGFPMSRRDFWLRSR